MSSQPQAHERLGRGVRRRSKQAPIRSRGNERNELDQLAQAVTLMRRVYQVDVEVEDGSGALDMSVSGGQATLLVEYEQSSSNLDTRRGSASSRLKGRATLIMSDNCTVVTSGEQTFAKASTSRRGTLKLEKETLEQLVAGMAIDVDDFDDGSVASFEVSNLPLSQAHGNDTINRRPQVDAFGVSRLSMDGFDDITDSSHEDNGTSTNSDDPVTFNETATPHDVTRRRATLVLQQEEILDLEENIDIEAFNKLLGHDSTHYSVDHLGNGQDAFPEKPMRRVTLTLRKASLDMPQGSIQEECEGTDND